MEIVIIFILIALVLWIVSRVMAKNRAAKDAALDEAWRVVLGDPDYVQRREREERKRDGL